MTRSTGEQLRVGLANWGWHLARVHSEKALAMMMLGLVLVITMIVLGLLVYIRVRQIYYLPRCFFITVTVAEIFNPITFLNIRLAEKGLGLSSSNLWNHSLDWGWPSIS